MKWMSDRLRILSRAPKLLALTLGMGLFMVLYIWLSFYNGMQRDNNAAMETAAQSTANLANIFKEHAERSLENADYMTEFLRKAYKSAPIDSPRLINMMPQDFLYRMYIFDTAGNCVASNSKLTDQFRSTILSRYLSTYQLLDTSALIIGQDVWDHERRCWSLPLMRRLTDQNGYYQGMVVMMANTYYFSDLYNRLDIDPDSLIFLFGRDRYVRATKNHSVVTPEMPLDYDTSILQSIEKTDRKTTIVSSAMPKGQRYIYSYCSLTRYPLTVAVGIPESSVTNALIPKIERDAAISIGLTLGLLLLLLVMLRFLYHQLLMESEVQLARDGLQKTVEARTSELLEANRQLTQMNQSLENINEQLKEEVTEHQSAVEKLRLADEEMKHIAYYDPSTQLPNRLCYHKWLAETLQQEHPSDASGTIMAINLDNLQTVNDVFGHSYGDAVIQEAAQRISREAGENSFIAHCGADEFAAAFPGMVNVEEIDDTARRLLTAIRHVQHFNNITIHVTASIGIAVYPAHGTSPEELLKNVDNALSSAKENGKNQWCSFSEDLRTALYENVLLTAQLHNAIKKKEFLLYYQPQIEVSSGRVIGFEALIRWISPELGFISPGSFIPLAEKKGLIHEIGQWVMQESCRFAVRLSQMGWGDRRIAINVSGLQFSQDTFLETFHKIMQETSVNPQQIELEITETAIMKSLEGTVRKLDMLRSSGVQISLDDFGTGYSSLNYLLRMPFDTLKIDKSFIDMVGHDNKGSRIVDAILLMAHILEKHVVAEGVETQEQLEYLRHAGCDTIQGFFFSKPLPENEAIDFLQHSIQDGGVHKDA